MAAKLHGAQFREIGSQQWHHSGSEPFSQPPGYLRQSKPFKKSEHLLRTKKIVPFRFSACDLYHRLQLGRFRGIDQQLRQLLPKEPPRQPAEPRQGFE